MGCWLVWELCSPSPPPPPTNPLLPVIKYHERILYESYWYWNLIVQTIKLIFSLSPHLLPLARKWNNVAGVAVHGNWDVHCAHHLSFRLCFYCHLAALWENDHCFLHFFRGRQLHWCYIATWSHHLGHGQGYRDGRRQWKWRRRHYCCGW